MYGFLIYCAVVVLKNINLHALCPLMTTPANWSSFDMITCAFQFVPSAFGQPGGSIGHQSFDAGSTAYSDQPSYKHSQSYASQPSYDPSVKYSSTSGYTDGGYNSQRSAFAPPTYSSEKAYPT